MTNAVVGAGTLERVLVQRPVRQPSPARVTQGNGTAQRPSRHERASRDHLAR